MSESVLLWSSPVRRCGTRTLSTIPNEIYFEIFSYIKLPYYDGPATRRHLFNLAQVCRFFCFVLLPWIYEHLKIDAKIKKSDGSSNNYQSFCRSIVKGDEAAQTVAQHVKKCTFDAWDVKDDQLDWCMEELLAMCSKAVRSMKNIREVNFVSTTITKDLVKAITSLPQLDSLNLNDCLFADNIAEKHVKNMGLLKLKSLCFLLRDGNNVWLSKELQPRIRPAIFDHINLSYLLKLETNSAGLCQRLAETTQELSLEHLDFSSLEVDPPTLLEFVLPKTKALRTLRYLSFNRTSSLNLHPDALPRLECVKCPLEHLKFLIPGRYVSSIDILRRKDGIINLSDIHILCSSKASITHLHVSSECYATTPFSEYFPHLLSLQLTFTFVSMSEYVQGDIGGDLEKKISTVFQKWTKHPPLQDIILVFDVFEWAPNSMFNLKQQHKWVSEIIFPHFPSLRRCQFEKSVDWIYFNEESEWKPQVVQDQAQSLVRRLKNRAYEDYHGFFKYLLDNAQWI